MISWPSPVWLTWQDLHLVQAEDKAPGQPLDEKGRLPNWTVTVSTIAVI